MYLIVKARQVDVRLDGREVMEEHDAEGFSCQCCIYS